MKKTSATPSSLSNSKEVGTPQVQIAILTDRIKHLTEHLKQQKKDHSSKRGLLNLVSKRSKMLRYLERKDVGLYRSTCKALSLRK